MLSRNQNIHLSNLVLILIGTCVLALLYKSQREGFTNLMPNVYPLSVDKPILVGDYPVKKDPWITDLDYSEMYKAYPIFPADSTINNNIRYWKNPDNGDCSPAEFCGSTYNDKKVDVPPPPPKPEDAGARVNYYDSCRFTEDYER